MRPLTDHTPKPLLHVQGKPLLQWPMQALAVQGFVQVLVNTGWLGEQIPAHFGHTVAHAGAADTHLRYSREELDCGHALETAGGIARALPQLAEVFWLAAGDVFAPDFCFARAHYQHFAASTARAHLWLVPNPAHNPAGDFAWDATSGTLYTRSQRPDLPTFTYSTIALLRRTLFAPPWCDIPPGNPQGIAAPLAPVLRSAIEGGQVSASLYQGQWVDVGTPERLAALNA